MNFAEILKYKREEKEITQTELAKIIDVSQPSVSAWESGENEPKASYILKLAKFFDISTDELLGCQESFKPIQTIYPKHIKLTNVSISVTETKEKTIIEIEK